MQNYCGVLNNEMTIQTVLHRNQSDSGLEDGRKGEKTRFPVKWQNEVYI